jgi:hypothetical protein
MSLAHERSRGVMGRVAGWCLWPALLLLLSLPVFLPVYGIADDYIGWMWWTRDWAKVVNSVFWGHGRYLLGFLVRGGFLVCDELPELVWLRVASALGWGVFAALLARWVLPRSFSWGWRFLLTAAITLCPSTALSIAYAVCYPYGWAAVLALVAGQWTVEAMREGGRAGVARAWRLSLAVVILAVSFAIYQTISFYFLLPLVIHAPEPEWRRWWASLWTRGMVVFGVGMGVYALVHYTLRALAPEVDAAMARQELATFSWERAELLARYLGYGAQSWAGLAPAWIGWIVGVAVAGLAAVGARRGPGVIPAVGVLLLAVALPVMVRELVFFTRLLAVPYAVFAYLALAGLKHLLESRRGAPGGAEWPWIYGGSGLLAACMLVLPYLGLVKPCVVELARVRAIAAGLEDPPKKIYYVMPDCGAGLNWPGRPLAEYSRPASCMPPNAFPLIVLGLKERFPEHPDSRIPWFSGEVEYFWPSTYEAAKAAGGLDPEASVWRVDGFVEDLPGARWEEYQERR